MPDNPCTAQIIRHLSHFCERNYCVVFCWVPGHSGLCSTEVAYAAAKEAAIDRTPLCDWALATNICAYLYWIMHSWQDEWTDMKQQFTKISDWQYRH